jgi:LysR family transcriptional regulator, regulator for genes of the gallate degradation pathway
VRVNVRHLRVFLAVTDSKSTTRAAEIALVSQPAVTQAIAKLEREFETALFQRTPQGMHPTPAGEALANRVRRAFALVDGAFLDVSPRLSLTATSAQLQALIAVREAQNFTLAARRLGIAQPTVHRAITQLEQAAGRALFERTSYGTVATRPAQALAQAARLAFAELAQAEAEVADTLGREVGQIVIGAMPLSRSTVLPAAIGEFRKRHAKLPIEVLDGPYDDLIAGLRRGEIDFLIGALRDPAPIGDVEQRALFADDLVLVSRRGHPLADADAITVADLAQYPWVVARPGTPTRAHFDRLFAQGTAPISIVHSGSLILMRELLELSDHLGCISRLQAQAETDRGLMAVLPFEMTRTSRRIGLTLRAGWLPTRAQREFIRLLSPERDQAHSRNLFI